MKSFIPKKIFFISLFCILTCSTAQSLPLDDPNIKGFINDMVSKHGFNEAELKSVFSDTKRSNSILEAISRPAEKKLTWGEYRKIFLDNNRITSGVDFWKTHRAELERAYQIYGVEPEIIVAIIGIETRYGRITGKHRVIDALSTLAFYYPKRSKFFSGQLVEFLLLARQQNFDLFSLTGSYAGAMGIPQFIPSSYRHYAVDFDEDGITDIWSNPVDAIGSVANYFAEHRWKQGGSITIPASVKNDKYRNAPRNKLENTLSIYELSDFGVVPSQDIDNQSKYSLLELTTAKGEEYWLGMHNFYVITRYNHSHLYAMAAYQLSRKIKQLFMQGYTK